MDSKLTDFEKYLITKVRSDYDYWQGYANLFESKEKEINDRKEEVFKLFKDSPDSDEAKKAMMFIQYDYQHHIEDLKAILYKLTALYTMADTLKLTDQFTDSLNAKMQKIKDTEKKNTFIFDDNKLKERVEGEREKFLNSLPKDPRFNAILSSVIKEIDK